MSERPTAALAVLGSPISHSLSPALHAAAYRVLGLSWTYDAIEMTGDRLRDFVDGLDDGWRGLSLTMPLKRDVIALLDRTDEVVDLTGSANTVLLDAHGRSGFNTDVFGIVDAVRAARVDSVQIVGAGATAASSVVAARSLGAAAVHVSARSLARAEMLRPVAERIGLRLTIGSMQQPAASVPDLIINTLPGGASPWVEFDHQTMSAATLLEVAYDPWPGPLAMRWMSVGGRVVPGIEMLVSQALAQVRVFVGGDPQRALDGESHVLAAMRDAVGLRPHPAS